MLDIHNVSEAYFGGSGGHDLSGFVVWGCYGVCGWDQIKNNISGFF